jgi:Uma2 family endonuclease
MSAMPSGDPTDAGRSGVRLTYDDLSLLPDDGRRHELIDGEHVVTPAPNTTHQRICRRLTVILGTWLDLHPLGELLAAPYDVVLSEVDAVQPDLLYISSGRVPQVITPQHVVGAPDLVIEIASPSTRAREETVKCRLYERFGVAEYWLVDPDVESVRVYRRSGTRFDRPLELSRERADMLTTPLLPEFELPLARIFQK